jgi:hypothetical protein
MLGLSFDLLAHLPGQASVGSIVAMNTSVPLILPP